MAKWANDDIMDAALKEVAKGNKLIVCAGQPNSKSDAETKALASTTMTPGVGTDFSLSNGASSGRKLTVGAKQNFNITKSGAADHIAIVDATRLLYVTTCSSQQLTSGNTVTVQSWDIEIADPS